MLVVRSLNCLTMTQVVHINLLRNVNLCIVPCVPEHEVHELQPLAAQEALAVGGLQQRAAKRVEHVFHRLLLLRAARVVTLVELHTTTIRAMPVNQLCCVAPRMLKLLCTPLFSRFPH